MKSIREKRVLVSVFTIVFIALIINGNIDADATGIADEINVTIPVACSLTSIIDSAHATTIENGVYQDNIGETTFKVFCNDAEGFSIFATGYTNDEFGNDTLKPTSINNSYAIATGIATSGDTSNWAMKLTAVSGDYSPTLETGFNDYHEVPADYTKVASLSANTDAIVGSSFKSTYAVFASQNQPSGSYSGKVKFTIVHPSNELAPIEDIKQLTYMQDFNDLTPLQKTAVLNSMNYNTTYDLIDNRDNKTYKIARLKDDNIWMAENLDLGKTELSVDLTSANTNLNTTISAATFNSWKKTSGTGTFTSAEFISVSGTDSVSNSPYGTLYNYCASSAGTYCAEESNDDSYYDICPAGWRLPIGGSSGEYKALYNLTDYNSAAKIRAPIVSGGAAFARPGLFYDSTPINISSDGNYRTSTNYNENAMYSLSLYASVVLPANRYDRSYGASVRCILKM